MNKHYSIEGCLASVAVLVSKLEFGARRLWSYTMPTEHVHLVRPLHSA